MPRTSWLALLCFSGAVCFAQQQTPPAAPAAAPQPAPGPELASHDTQATFSTRVNLVMVPVVVRDHKGKAIGNLQKEDFQLFDKGKPQVISKFSVEKAGAHAIQVQAEPADKDSEAAVTAPGKPAPTRFTVYLFDDLHLEFGDLAQTRTAAAKHIDETLQPTDRAAIYTTSAQTVLDFTDDHEALKQALLKIQPRSRSRPVGSDCPDVSYYVADLIQNKSDNSALAMVTADVIACMNMDPRMAQQAESLARGAASRVLGIGDAEVQSSLELLRNSVRRLSIMPGERKLVFVSPGFLINLNYRQEETEIFDRAIRANVSISTLDARGLWVPTMVDASKRGSTFGVQLAKSQYDRESQLAEGDVLGELADGTGGTFFHNNNDLHEGFRLTAASPEFVYVLGFSPQNLKLDGAFHALKVNVKVPSGLNLQARRGYYAPKHQVNPAEQAKQEIAEALFSREEMSEIPVALQTQFFKPTDVTAKLSVVAKVDVRPLHFRDAESRHNETLTIVSGIFDRNGNLISAIQKSLEMKLKDATLAQILSTGITVKTSFDVTPGSYVVRLIVRDAEGQLMTARNGVVEIP